jgi:hypothetical protein
MEYPSTDEPINGLDQVIEDGNLASAGQVDTVYPVIPQNANEVEQVAQTGDQFGWVGSFAKDAATKGFNFLMATQAQRSGIGNNNRPPSYRSSNGRIINGGAAYGGQSQNQNQGQQAQGGGMLPVLALGAIALAVLG